MYEMNEDEMYDAHVEQEMIEAEARKGEETPKEKFYIAILRTGGKTFEEAEKELGDSIFFSPEDKTKCINEHIERMNVIDGATAIVATSFASPNKYDVLQLSDDDQDKMKEFCWLAEQDELFGAYDDRAEFEKDWANGEYEFCGVLTVEAADVEIKSELKKKVVP